MAHNHRMQPISDPYLNARNAAGFRGVNYSPEDDTYDLAEGPKDRVRRQSDVVSSSMVENENEEENERMMDRRMRGEN